MMSSNGVGNLPAQRCFYLDYLGSITFHRSYVTSMSRWLIAWIKMINHSSVQHTCVTFHEKGIFIKTDNKDLLDANNCSAPKNNNNVVSNFDAISEVSHSAYEDLAETEFFIKFNQVFEVIFPTDYEKFCLSIIVNQGNESSLMLLVFQSNDFTTVSYFAFIE